MVSRLSASWRRRLFLHTSFVMLVSPVASWAATVAAPNSKATHRVMPAHAPVHQVAAAPEAIKVSTQHIHFMRQQHVADSATHIDHQELVNRNVRQMTDIAWVAPNLTIQPSFGSAGLNFALRGIGLMDFTQNNTPSVMPYVDGVAYPISIMTSGMLFDMDSISVNPGPGVYPRSDDNGR